MWSPLPLLLLLGTGLAAQLPDAYPAAAVAAGRRSSRAARPPPSSSRRPRWCPTQVTRHAVSTLISSVTVNTHQTRVIPSTILTTVVQTVPVQSDRTVYSEQLQQTTETETVRLPAATNFITNTEVQTETRRHVEHRTSLVVRTVTSTALSTGTITRTQTVASTVFYPSQVLRFVTETQTAEPVTVTHVQLRQLRHTITSQAPAQTVYRTQRDYEIVITSTVAQPDVRTRTETVTRVSTQLVTRTALSTLYRTAVQHETQVVPQVVEPVTVTEVVPVTVTPPPVVQQSTITSQIASTSVFTTTQLVTQLTTRVVEVKGQCEGYQYNTPQNPLQMRVALLLCCLLGVGMGGALRRPAVHDSTEFRPVVQVSTQVVDVTRRLTATQTRTVTRTQLEARPVTETVTATYVAAGDVAETTQVSTFFVTETERLPAETSFITSTQVQTEYATRTVLQPANTIHITSTAVQPFTRVLTSTQLVPSLLLVTSTELRTHTETATETERLFRTNTRTETVVSTALRTRLVTVQRDVAITSTQQRLVTSTVRLPAVTVTLTRNAVRHVTQHAPASTVTRVTTSTRTALRFLTSVVASPVVSEVVVTSTIPADCGYNYETPSGPAFGF
ncbi:hypothetical protein FJT64_002978 [Amphibalanus amphitrite]|uniref:Zonadhesin n=1 Tax=Amphibalanus amphitrite TaxID=1232801 RepID=A0A6A4WET0_AMPAM|nr:hypothetical protein FJT64_002978 [Amphibalanus amphitrite]